MTKLFYTDKPIIGLDISNTGIKVMTIDIKRWLVLGYGSIDLDPNKVKESFEGNSTYLADNIQSLIKENCAGHSGMHTPDLTNGAYIFQMVKGIIALTQGVPLWIMLT